MRNWRTVLAEGSELRSIEADARQVDSLQSEIRRLDAQIEAKRSGLRGDLDGTVREMQELVADAQVGFSCRESEEEEVEWFG